MTQTIAKSEAMPVIRPLHVLVPLIKKDLLAGDDAAERAGMPYYLAAGEKLLEAKGQLERGEFEGWVERNFGISQRHAQTYMKLARATSDDEKRSETRFSTLRDVERDSGNQNYGKPASWQEPVRETLKKVDLETLNIRKAELKRAEERDAQRKLALQLIDIGYKALASKLHPDKGGSREAMSRLNQVRDRLKGAA